MNVERFPLMKLLLAQTSSCQCKLGPLKAKCKVIYLKYSFHSYKDGRDQVPIKLSKIIDVMCLIETC